MKTNEVLLDSQSAYHASVVSSREDSIYKIELFWVSCELILCTTLLPMLWFEYIELKQFLFIAILATLFTWRMVYVKTFILKAEIKAAGKLFELKQLVKEKFEGAINLIQGKKL